MSISFSLVTKLKKQMVFKIILSYKNNAHKLNQCASTISRILCKYVIVLIHLLIIYYTCYI